MKPQFTTDLNEQGKRVESTFAIKFKKPPIDYKNKGKTGKWFEIRLADKKGEITAKYWGKDENLTNDLYNSLKEGYVIYISGIIQEYPHRSGIFSISVDGETEVLRNCKPDEYDEEDFVSSTSKNIDQMLSDIKRILLTVNESHLNMLFDLFLNDNEFVKSFSESPAAMYYHQNYKGGLLEHTLNCCVA